MYMDSKGAYLLSLFRDFTVHLKPLNTVEILQLKMSCSDYVAEQTDLALSCLHMSQESIFLCMTPKLP